MNGGAEVLVIDDKQCPACDYYCNMVRIRASVGRLVLVDARDGGPVMDEITARGLDMGVEHETCDNPDASCQALINVALTV
jgi:hypothetical protein